MKSASALVPNDRFSEGYEELLGYAEELEAEVLGMIRRRRESGAPGNDVLSILVRTHDEEGGLSDEELVGQAAVLFGAAHMTTAHSLTWTLLLLAHHPSVMRRLWDEIGGDCESQPTNNPQFAIRNPKSLGSLPKGDDLSFLDCAVKESMRLLPASAYSQRINTVAVQLGPLHLPRGTGIVFTPIVTHHLADLYPEPEKFVPDRWRTLRPSPYAYHPFGAGPQVVHWCTVGDGCYPRGAETNHLAVPTRRGAGQQHRSAHRIDHVVPDVWYADANPRSGRQLCRAANYGKHPRVGGFR